jgi:hypothetical protein
MAAPTHPTPGNSAGWTIKTVSMGVEILDRMERAVAKVRERLLRATGALNQAGVPYAVVAGTPWLPGWQRSMKALSATRAMLTFSCGAMTWRL